MAEKPHFTMRIRPEDRDALNAVARDNGTSAAELIRERISDDLERGRALIAAAERQ